MTAVLAIIGALISALAPLVPKLISGTMSAADAKAAADKAVAGYHADMATLATVEAANDAAADEANSKP